jgi:hypothetical protein
LTLLRKCKLRLTKVRTTLRFEGFLSTYRAPILIILLVAFGWRLVLVIGFPHDAFDEPRYTAPAINLLAGRGFSSDVHEPYLPSEHAVPRREHFSRENRAKRPRHNYLFAGGVCVLQSSAWTFEKACGFLIANHLRIPVMVHCLLDQIHPDRNTGDVPDDAGRL